MRVALAVLLVPAVAAAGPKFWTTISADAPFGDGVASVRGKLDACWRTATSIKLRVTVTGGVVKDIVLVEVDPKAPLPCVTKALRGIKLDPATAGDFELALSGSDEPMNLLKVYSTGRSQVGSQGSFKGLDTFVGTGTRTRTRASAPRNVRVNVETPDGTPADIEQVMRLKFAVSSAFEISYPFLFSEG